MSFVSTNNKSGMGGLTTTTPPITGETVELQQVRLPEAWREPQKRQWNRRWDL